MNDYLTFLTSFMLPTVQQQGVEQSKFLQSRIAELPSINGQTELGGDDKTPRVDKSGNVYIWDADMPGGGAWLRAGQARLQNFRYGQPLDPRDIRWLDMKSYKNRMAAARAKAAGVRGKRAIEDDVQSDRLMHEREEGDREGSSDEREEWAELLREASDAPLPKEGALPMRSEESSGSTHGFDEMDAGSASTPKKTEPPQSDDDAEII